MSEKNNIRLQELSHKWLRGTLSNAEKAEFDQWFNRDTEGEMHIPVNVAQSREEHEQLLYNRIRLAAGITQKPKQFKLWPRIAVASAVALMIIGAGLFYFSFKQKQQFPAIAYQQDIAPGKQGATLTLASGKQIRLNDSQNGKLAEEAGVSITKSADGNLVYQISEKTTEPGSINTLTTAKGETYQLRLPDGSVVWLNAASSLSYTANLVRGSKRSVKLTGEAYFEIAKDKAHPFVVATNDQEVEVLGTHFNINNYNNEPATITTLLEGSVRIKTLKAAIAKIQILKPGQQSLLRNNQINVSSANIDEATAWKDGDFLFNAQDIQSIMRKLERWYNIEVVYEGTLPEDKFQGVISRFRNISQVLTLLEQTKAVHFKIQGRRVIVSK